MLSKTYMEAFVNQRDLIDHMGGTVGSHHSIYYMMLKEMRLFHDTASQEEKNKARDAIEEMYLDMAYLVNANRTKHGKLLEK